MFDSLKKYKFLASVTFLIALYFFGMVGILSENKTIDFLSLTPLNLLINSFLLLINHENGSQKQFLLFIIIAIAGFFIELIGVNTGLVFGNYRYDTTLGWKIFNTPLIIGVNWIMLTYAVVYSLSNKITNRLIVAAISAIILLTLDILIEPVAMQYGFWSWFENVVPIKNYIAWFIVSYIFCYAIAHFKGNSSNKLALYLIVCQFIFFGIFNFTLWN